MYGRMHGTGTADKKSVGEDCSYSRNLPGLVVALFFMNGMLGTARGRKQPGLYHVLLAWAACHLFLLQATSCSCAESICMRSF